MFDKIDMTDVFFFFNDTATTEIYTLSLHDALPISQDVADGLRAGLAARGLHDLSDEKLEDAFVSGFELGDVRRVFGDDFAGGLFDGGGADLRAEAFGGDNLCCTAAGFEHGGENFFPDGAGDFGGFD